MITTTATNTKNHQRNEQAREQPTRSPCPGCAVHRGCQRVSELPLVVALRELWRIRTRLQGPTGDPGTAV
jgi:hypothetical protein